jgi:N-sulfoglucosamine sulfohydrolase
MRTLLCLVALFCPLLTPTVARAADKARRNVVLLIADDLGLQVGCYGDAKARTPNIDALARSGVRFSHAFATVSSCSPSRAALFTGLHTHASGQYGLAHAEHNFHTRAGVRSLPALLRPAGYYTGIIGKVHVLPLALYPFDIFAPGGRDVLAMSRAARKFFADSRGRPFFLVMGYADPHRAAKGFANEKSYPGVKEERFGPEDVTLPYYLPDQPDARRDWADYYRSINRLDQGVGMLMKELREAGLERDTLVIFLSDNGPPFPGAKTTLYDAGTHLPLIVSAPTLRRRGLVNRAMVSWVDIAPTILDWCGVPAPARMHGRSFLPILAEESPRGWDQVFGSHQFHEVTMYYPMRSVRTRTHRYVLNLAHRLEYPFAADLYASPTWQGVLRRHDRTIGRRTLAQFLERPREELYDLTKDPNELKNVAGEASYAAVLAELRKRVRDMQERTGDPWVIKYRHE